MKIFHALLITLIVSVYNAVDKCSGVKGEKAGDCQNLEIDSAHYKCCYAHSKVTIMGQTQEKKECQQITKTEYDNIKDEIKKAKEQIEKMGGKVDTFDIDCNSNYLYISLLSLIIFLL